MGSKTETVRKTAQEKLKWSIFPDNRATREGKKQALAVPYNTNLLKRLI